MSAAGPGQVLIAVRAAGINPGEGKIRAGLVRAIFPATFPSGEGSDLAGVVEEVGAGVSGVGVGDEVIGFTNNRASHAEYVLVDAGNVTPKPAAVPWEVAGALFVAGVTGAATVRAVAPGPGEAVVVAGAGAVSASSQPSSQSAQARGSSRSAASAITHGCASAARLPSPTAMTSLSESRRLPKIRRWQRSSTLSAEATSNSRSSSVSPRTGSTRSRLPRDREARRQRRRRRRSGERNDPGRTGGSNRGRRACRPDPAYVPTR